MLPPYARAEVGGRRCRQPGQVRKEAATTISCRVVGFHLPFSLGHSRPPCQPDAGPCDERIRIPVLGLRTADRPHPGRNRGQVRRCDRYPPPPADWAAYSISRPVRPRGCRRLLALRLVIARSAPRSLENRVHRTERSYGLLFLGVDDLSPQRG